MEAKLWVDKLSATKEVLTIRASPQSKDGSKERTLFTHLMGCLPPEKHGTSPIDFHVLMKQM